MNLYFDCILLQSTGRPFAKIWVAICMLCLDSCVDPQWPLAWLWVDIYYRTFYSCIINSFCSCWHGFSVWRHRCRCQFQCYRRRLCRYTTLFIIAHMIAENIHKKTTNTKVQNTRMGSFSVALRQRAFKRFCNLIPKVIR